MRILIAEDEPPAVDRLRVLLGSLPEVRVVGTAINGREALRAIAELRPDLVLLDIQMPEMSGLQVASDLQGDRPEIVFVTAFENFAPDAFAVDAADYLLKPVRFDRLRQAIQRADRRARERAALAAAPHAARSEEADEHRQGFWAPTRTGQVRVSLASIDWIEAAKDYVLLHTPARSYMLRMTMAAMEEKLAGSDLIRAHRSAFIRPDRVQAVERTSKWQMSLTMRDGVSVPVGPSHMKKVLAAIGVQGGDQSAMDV